MTEKYNKLYVKCLKLKNPSFKQLKKIEQEWNKLTIELFKDTDIKDITELWTLLNEEMCDSENYFNNFVSYLCYSADRMNINRWCRLQLLLGNATNEAYRKEEVIKSETVEQRNN